MTSKEIRVKNLSSKGDHLPSHLVQLACRFDSSIEVITEGRRLNAKSLMGWQKQVGPEEFVLTCYRELGGELITVGSDSHSPKTMGNGIEQAMNRLRELGFRNVYTFDHKKPVAIPL